MKNFQDRCANCDFLTTTETGHWYCGDWGLPCKNISISDCVMSDVDKNNMTKEQLEDLRREICLGSLYTTDYENQFGIDPTDVQAFFDGFIEDCWDLADYEDRNIKDVEGIFGAYDDIEHLYDYYCSCEYPFGE